MSAGQPICKAVQHKIAMRNGGRVLDAPEDIVIAAIREQKDKSCCQFCETLKERYYIHSNSAVQRGPKSVSALA
jgi:hypothetical protein